MDRPGHGRVGRRPRRLVSFVRATANIVTLVAAIAFVVSLALSRGDAGFEWYAARTGLVALFGLLVSFVAIVIENRQSDPEEARPR